VSPLTALLLKFALRSALRIFCQARVDDYFCRKMFEQDTAIRGLTICMRSIVSYLIIASIFISGTGLTESFGFRMYWYHPLYLFVLLYGFYVSKKISFRFLLVFVGIVLYTLLTFDSGVMLVIKQLINLGVSFLVFYILIVNERHSLEELFRKYLRVAKILLVIGFIQVGMYLIGLGPVYRIFTPHLGTYGVSARLQSLVAEPSFVALTFAPVLVIALHNIFYGTRYFLSRAWSYLFLLGYLLTLSTVAYVGLFIVLLLLYFKNFSYTKLSLVLVIFGILGLMTYYTYLFVGVVRLRVDDTVKGLSTNILEGTRYREVNLSTYSFLVNLEVTRKAFDDRPLTGNGLGTHEFLYDKYTPPQLKEFKHYDLNRQDATSMAIRLLSETGLIGLGLFCFFTFKYKAKSSSSFPREIDMLWVLNTGIFVFILIALLRNGNYTAHGKILFFMLHYYTGMQIANWKRKHSRIVLEPATT
jgi:hypothetical protein